MIKEHCFSEEWINGFRKEKKYSKINPPVLEKMINALSLLIYLIKNNLDFVFKGGTSLIILIDDGNRFSVDIDILTVQNREKIETIFNKVVENSHFLNWQLDEHRSYKSGIPKAHYKFEFDSVFSNQTNTVLLDILKLNWFSENRKLKFVILHYLRKLSEVMKNLLTIRVSAK